MQRAGHYSNCDLPAWRIYPDHQLARRRPAAVHRIHASATGRAAAGDSLSRLDAHSPGHADFRRQQDNPWRRTDLDAAPEISVAKEDGPAVRIAGKATVKPESVTEDGEDDEEVDGAAPESESPEAAEAESAPGTKPGQTAAEPRFKRPRKSEREEVMEELDAASRTEEADEYELPSIELLLPGEEVSYEEHEKEVRRQAKILEKTFLNFGFRVKVVEIETGPVIAQFEVELEAGLRLSKITSLADDLAIALACRACASWLPSRARIRWESRSPIPGASIGAIARSD